MSIVLESGPLPLIGCHETEVAHRWWALPVGALLPLIDGSYYRLLFAGYRGSATGPDVHDAVLLALPSSCLSDETEGQARWQDDYHIVGDVEFHLRSSDWIAHGHHNDPRYNHVVLHVVLLCDDARPTLRQDGGSIPVCSLYELAPPSLLPLSAQEAYRWPCQSIMPRLSEHKRNKLLMHAGLLRFEQKTQAFVEQLRAIESSSISRERYSYDDCLVPALAEALGYGRDRDFFRAVGYWLMEIAEALPEPLGRASQPSPLDAGRLHCLRKLTEQWRDSGAWQAFRRLLHDSGKDIPSLLRALRLLFCRVGLSLARSDIIICNVVLPFAAAVALIENDPMLFERAQALYQEHPGLPSNRITRMMSRQLQLAEEPSGGCQQQGLHYIYQQTCHEKRCGECIAGKYDL